MKRTTFMFWATGFLALCVLLIALRRQNSERSPAPAAIEPASATPVHKPRLPAPVPPRPAASTEPVELPARPTNWLAQLLNGEWPRKPDRAAIDAYLTENRRTPESLLAAYRITEDPELLREAAEKYPDNPQVAFTAMFKAKSPEERRQWIDAFKKAAPDNALADYLSADAFFSAGQSDRAIGELMSAAAKPKWQDYAREQILNAEEAYRAAGYSEAEAKAAASLGLPLPQLARLRDVGRQIHDLADAYRAGGDESSAQSAVQIGVDLARRITEGSGSQWIIQDLVGIATERRVLENVDPASPYDHTGHTVQQRLDELARRAAELKDLSRQSDQLFRNLPEPELARYIDRWNASGELEALRWLLNRRAAPPTTPQ